MELFVTHGYGLESIVEEELRNSGVELTLASRTHVGKIFFYVDSLTVNCLSLLITRLKTVERLFGIIFLGIEEKYVLDETTFLNDLFSMCSAHEIKAKLRKWAQLKSELEVPITSTDIDNAPPTKKHRSADEFNRFRVNVKISGSSRNLVNFRNAAKSVGSAIIKSLGSEGWQVELRNPNIEISVYITDTGLILAVQLTRKPISDRSYLVHQPLRSTIAAAMGRLMWKHSVKKGHPLLLVDPMCGSGTILVELLQLGFSDQLFDCIGLDNSELQLARAQENVKLAGFDNCISLLQCDIRLSLPIRLKCDGILCDMPFGKQHGGTEFDVKKNLPVIVKCMNSALVENGVLILLMSIMLSHVLEKEGIAQGWQMIEKYPLRLGMSDAILFVFRKHV